MGQGFEPYTITPAAGQISHPAAGQAPGGHATRDERNARVAYVPRPVWLTPTTRFPRGAQLNRAGWIIRNLSGSWTLRFTPPPSGQHTSIRKGLGTMTVHEAIEAVKEETELEHLVEVLGDDRAQEAAERHTLTALVYEMNGVDESR